MTTIPGGEAGVGDVQLPAHRPRALAAEARHHRAVPQLTV